MKGQYTKKSVWMGIATFFIVLFTMPLGHALMIIMEKTMTPHAVNWAAFWMGVVGIVMTIYGIFVKGDTKQTLLGLFGGLLFWTGWVEFLYVYYAHRFGVQPLYDAAGNIVTKPEYLIMPTSLGFFVMFMMLYIFSAKTGCYFIEWIQKKLLHNKKVEVQLKPMAHHSSLVTFLELNVMMWCGYLILLICYDDHFLGDRHPVTIALAIVCLVASFYMMRYQLKIKTWGYSIRYAISTVIVFWNFVEIVGRWNWITEIWVHPSEYKTEMITMLIVFILLFTIIASFSRKKIIN